MTSRKAKLVVIVTSLAATIGFFAAPALLADKHLAASKLAAMSPTTATQCKASCKANLPRLADALKAIDAATKAVEAGEKTTALAELTKARGLVAATHTALTGPQFVNARCPIMGSPINPANVSARLTREHNGAKVAFCCGGCPAAWDKLSVEQKDAKLAKVLPASAGKACGPNCAKPCCAAKGEAKAVPAGCCGTRGGK